MLKNKAWFITTDHLANDYIDRLLYSRGSMVELLISSNISRYAEFKACSRVLTVKDGKLEHVPSSRYTFVALWQRGSRPSRVDRTPSLDAIRLLKVFLSDDLYDDFWLQGRRVCYQTCFCGRETDLDEVHNILRRLSISSTSVWEVQRQILPRVSKGTYTTWDWHNMRWLITTVFYYYCIFSMRSWLAI